MTVSGARPWLEQAASDLRSARLLFRYVSDTQAPAPDDFARPDAGCHIAAMCAQTIEKSIKGYMILNGATPKLDHAPNKYLPPLLSKTRPNPILYYQDHQRSLQSLFDQDTRAIINELQNFTPGASGQRTDLANTEYPWKEAGDWSHAPCGAAQFAEYEDWKRWIGVATRIHVCLHGLLASAQRESPP